MASPSLFLPKRYMMITKIRSIRVRIALSDLIQDIFAIIDKHKDLTPDPLTKAKVDRFFHYLTNSCVSPYVVERRSTWLLKYAAVIYDHLIDTYRKTQYKGSSFVLDNDQLMEKILILIQTLSHYKVKVIDSTTDRLCQSLLESIVDLGSMVSDNPSSDDYTAIIKHLDEIIAVYSNQIQMNVYDNDLWVIIRQLHQMKFALYHYILHS